ncbi:hypothetical protein GCM10017744_015690 [Streptomyces antimycoticus]
MARRAGVSRATVSRVVNGSTKVAEESREAVLDAIQELGYIPNQAARSLVTQRTDSFALVLPEEPGRSSPTTVLPGRGARGEPGAGVRGQAAGADDGPLPRQP